MLTGELRSQIDAIWNSFWSGGISNPLEVMEQITYLLVPAPPGRPAHPGRKQVRDAGQADGAAALPRGG